MSVEPVRGKDGKPRRDKDGAIVHRVRWREGGRERSRVVGKRKLAEAFDAKLTLNRRVGGVGLIAAVEQTFAELASDWWDLYAEPNLAASTLASYGILLDKHLLPRIGGLRLRELTPETIEQLRCDLERARVGPRQTALALTLVHGILRRGVLWGRLAHNAAVGVPRPSSKRRRRPEIVPPETVEAIRARLRGLEVRGPRQWLDGLRDATLVSVLAYAGLRPFEALALTVECVGKRTLSLERAKLHRPRTVDLIGPLRLDLAEWLMARGRPGPRELVFPNRNGEPWPKDTWDNWRARLYSPAAAACGAPDGHRPYDLRHSFVSLLIHEGRSVAEVAEQAGHSPAVCLGTYLHVFREFDPAERKSAEQRIQEARAGATTRGSVSAGCPPRPGDAGP